MQDVCLVSLFVSASPAVRRSAVFVPATDRTPLRRLQLTRSWDAGVLDRGALVVVGLNPSVADDERDDPTIRRCVSFARREGCNELVMLNLHATVATQPTALWAQVTDGRVSRVMPDDEVATFETHLLRHPKRVVLAWGNGGALAEARVRQVLALLALQALPLPGAPSWRPPVAFASNTTGHPKHPLYVAADAPLQPFDTTTIQFAEHQP